MKYVKKPEVIEATRWFKNGDHPLDNCETFTSTGDIDLPKGTLFQGEGKIVRRFRHPGIPGNTACGAVNCGFTMHDHGWIDTPSGGFTVCPGDFIVTDNSGEHYPVNPSLFNDYVHVEE